MRFRSRTAGALVGLALLSSLGLPVEGASAVAPGPDQATNSMAKYASVSRSKEGTLRKGCHQYRYHYKVDSPTEQWALIVRVQDKTGTNLATDAVVWNSDPAKGTSTLRFCRASAKAGRFVIRGRFHYYEGYDEYVGNIKPFYFRLTRP